MPAEGFTDAALRRRRSRRSLRRLSGRGLGTLCSVAHQHRPPLECAPLCFGLRRCSPGPGTAAGGREAFPALPLLPAREVGGGWGEGALSGMGGWKGARGRAFEKRWDFFATMRKERKLLMQQLQTGNDIGIAPYFASRTFSITTELPCSGLLALQREADAERRTITNSKHLLS